MKIIKIILYLIITILFCCSCGKTNEFFTNTTNKLKISSDLNEIIPTINDKIITSTTSNVSVDLEINIVEEEKVYGSGSEIEPYVFAYNHIYYEIPSSFYNYVGDSEYKKWLTEVYKIGYEIPILNNFRMVPNCNIKHFIEYFDIDKESLIIILGNEYDPTGKINYKINNKQINSLYSDDLEEIYNAFPGDYSIFHNGIAYAPEWFMTNTTDEFIKENIPLKKYEIILTKMSNAKEIFSEKLINSLNVKMKLYENELNMQTTATSAATK